MLLWGLRGVLQFQLLRLDLQLTGRDLELGPLGYEIDGFFGAQARFSICGRASKGPYSTGRRQATLSSASGK